MTTAEEAAAGQVLAVRLVPRDGRLARAWIWLGSTLSAVTHEMLSPPSAGFLVVERRAGGTELHRIPAGTASEASELLARAEQELATLPLDDFCDEWGVPRP